MNLAEKIMTSLKASPYWKSTTRISGNTVQGLQCPVCGDKSAWAYAPGARSGPMAICCNRKNSCNAITKTVSLLNIHFDIEHEYPSLPTDKHRPARIYLESRGLKTSLKDLGFEYWPKVRKTNTGAVMFPVVSPNGGGKDEKNL